MNAPDVQVAIGDKTLRIESTPSCQSVRQMIASKTECKSKREDIDDSFFLGDAGRIIELCDLWRTALPDVKPFYAVKANLDPLLILTLSALGTGFESASKGEIRALLNFGVEPKKIIFAAPTKQISHIQYAAEVGVELMTFDCEVELVKIKSWHPEAKLLLRTLGTSTAKMSNGIERCDPDTYVHLQSKFGVGISAGKALLMKAKELDLNVVGVSFQMTAGNKGIGAESDQYKQAIESCHELFRYAGEIGHQFTLLDIGGGFSESQQSFEEIASEVEQYVTEFKHKYPGVDIIAEPGRYFAASPFTLAACVIGKKVTENGSLSYTLNDGIFGSFNKMAYFSQYPLSLQMLKEPTDGNTAATATFWGPTSAPDSIGKFSVVELNVGDWVYFESMGAYSFSLMSSFCGYPRPVTYYYVKDIHRSRLSQLLSS